MDKTAVIENLGKPVSELLLACGGYFDPKLAAKICRERSFPQKDELHRAFSLETCLGLFRTDSSRQEFLAFYLSELRASVVGRAACGCLRTAGTACVHDRALFQ